MALLKEIVPAELHDRPYLKDLLDKEQNPETFGAVFKKLDGAETLIGKKTVPGIPGADAKDEDWDKFLGQLRPGKPEEYDIPTKEGAKPDEAFIKELREAFLAGDISKRQASKFLKQFTGSLEKRQTAMLDAQKKADADFETLAKAASQEPEKLERAKKLMAEHAPAAVKSFIDKLDNPSLVILSGVINSIFEKYAPEDELKPKGGTTGGGGKTLREQARALNEEISKMDPMDSRVDALKTKMNDLYKQAAAAGA